MKFRIVGDITDIKTIAVGKSIRMLQLLIERHGRGRWRKKKGIATIEMSDGVLHLAEIHWYEAHGIGKKDIKIKFPFLD